MPKQRYRSGGTRSAGPESPLDRPGAETLEERTPDDLLDVLGDEYTRSVLEAIRNEPMSGTEVADATSMSKPTAFRRLNDLADIGLLEVQHRIDADDGHHHKEYHLVVDSVSVTFGDDLDVTVDADHTPSPARGRGAATLND